MTITKRRKLEVDDLNQIKAELRIAKRDLKKYRAGKLTGSLEAAMRRKNVEAHLADGSLK